MQLLSIADLRTIYEGVDSIDPQVRSRLLKYIENREETERHLQEEERRRREAIPEEAQDWQDVQTGTIVVRSEHWKENRCKPNDKQIGILVELKIFEDDLCGFIHWPIVHWEGEPFSSMCHPNIPALRDGVLPKKTMNANQQVKGK